MRRVAIDDDNYADNSDDEDDDNIYDADADDDDDDLQAWQVRRL